jgi:hypothetical protein
VQTLKLLTMDLMFFLRNIARLFHFDALNSKFEI